MSQQGGSSTPKFNTSDFLKWDVKPIWSITYPSIIIDDNDRKTIEIYGVNRTAGDITRNWEVIDSIEQFRQGFVAKPSDIRITIAVKERGKAFEVLRRLGKGAILFDVECSIVDDDTQNEVVGNWLEGFEKYIGCVITRETQTIDIGEIPIREFECLALRHSLLNVDTLSELIEGDGTFDGKTALSDAKSINE